MSTISPRRLPWSQAWFVDVREHYERTPQGLVRVPWAEADHVHAHVVPTAVGTITARIKVASQMEVAYRVDNERAGRRDVERRIQKHTEEVAARMQRERSERAERAEAGT